MFNKLNSRLKEWLIPAMAFVVLVFMALVLFAAWANASPGTRTVSARTYGKALPHPQGLSRTEELQKSGIES